MFYLPSTPSIHFLLISLPIYTHSFSVSLNTNRSIKQSYKIQYSKLKCNNKNKFTHWNLRKLRNRRKRVKEKGYETDPQLGITQNSKLERKEKLALL